MTILSVMLENVNADLVLRLFALVSTAGIVLGALDGLDVIHTPTRRDLADALRGMVPQFLKPPSTVRVTTTSGTVFSPRWTPCWVYTAIVERAIRLATTMSGDDVTCTYTIRLPPADDRGVHEVVRSTPLPAGRICVDRELGIYARFSETTVSAGTGRGASPATTYEAVLTSRRCSAEKIDAWIRDLIAELVPETDAIRCHYLEDGDWEPAPCVDRTAASAALRSLSDEGRAFLRDVEEFLSEEKGRVYAVLGKPRRRGYLLHGPPGTGKTTLVKAAAAAYNADVFMINLSSVSSDSDLLSALSRMSRRGGRVPSLRIVCIEDIDRVPVVVGNVKGEDVRLTLSGILNAIAGVVDGSPGALSSGARGVPTALVITANDPDKLPAALVRAGRIDMRVHVGPATAEQVLAMYRGLFGDDAHNRMTRSAPARTIAEVAELLYRNSDDPVAAAAALGMCAVKR